MFNSLPVSKKLKKKLIIKDFELYIMLLPVLVYFLIFKYLPMYGLQIAFKDFNSAVGIWGSEWVGFEHFTRFFDSYYFGRLLRNTLGLSLYNLVVTFPFPIILAIIINELSSEKLKKTVQTVTYLPHFLSTVILVGLLHVFLSHTGLVNQVIMKLGGESVAFMAQKENFKTIYVLSAVWQNTGWRSIVYLAVLTGINPNLLEAASIDGATRLQKIYHIIIPYLLPTAITLLILQTGKVMNVGFEKVILMQNPLNMEASDVISTYVYRQGLINSDYSFATAVGLFKSVINFALIFIVNKISRKVSETSLW